MSAPLRPEAVGLSIAAVERDTGLTKDTLRVWERRYGFPKPGRDPLGERAYPPAQVERLRILKRLLDAGHRPGRIIGLTLDELMQLCDSGPATGAKAASADSSQDLRELLELLQQHAIGALRHRLGQAQAQLGLGRFVIEVIAPMNTMVGEAWMRGQLQIFEEHLYTEAANVVLREAIARVPPAAPQARPRVLLSTLPGEPHGLGLLMAEAIFALEGAACLSLGVRTPPWDIVLAAAALKSDIVALGFTSCMSPNQIVDGLGELRAKLPPAVRLWAGGSSPVLHRRPVEGVLPVPTLQRIPIEIERWRQSQA